MPQYFLGLGSEILLKAVDRPTVSLAAIVRSVRSTTRLLAYLPEFYRSRGECLLALDRDNRKKRDTFSIPLKRSRGYRALSFSSALRSHLLRRYLLVSCPLALRGASYRHLN